MLCDMEQFHKPETDIGLSSHAPVTSGHLLHLLLSFLFQIERFNALLRIIKSSLIDLEKGIKGLVVMSSDLEETFNCIFDARVPPLWGKVSGRFCRNNFTSEIYTDTLHSPLRIKHPLH